MARFKGIGKAPTKGRPATEKQLEYIEQLTGEFPLEPLTVQRASDLIEELLAEQEQDDYQDVEPLSF